jgi:hypothetical protein
MFITIIVVAVLLFDFIFNLSRTKTAIANTRNYEFNLPYGSVTLFLLILTPSIMYNYLLINGCSSDTLTLNLIGYIVGVCILVAFLPVEEHSIKNLVGVFFITIVLNSLYCKFCAEFLYEGISNNSTTNLVFTIVTAILVVAIHFRVFDMFSKIFAYSYCANSLDYMKFINVLTCIILVFSFSKLSAFQYRYNIIESIGSGSNSMVSSTFQAIPEDTSSIESIEDYSPVVSTSNNAVYVSDDLPTLDSDIQTHIMKTYGMSNVNATVNWYIQDTPDFELLKYLQSMDCTHNPFYTARKLLTEYLDVTVRPNDFNVMEYENYSNNLKIDFSQASNESCEEYVKRIYSDIMNVCTTGLDLSTVQIGDGDNQKYIFSAFYNDITSTYDVLCLFFAYSGETVTNINYDLLSISESAIPVYSNYFDILPVYDGNSMEEKYQEYNIDDKYFVMFKYYNLGLS